MSVEKLKARIDNMNFDHKANREYFKRIRIRDYLPGQAIYTLGDYPAQVYSAVTDYDRELVKSMAEAGVDLIQLHEDWKDACRLYGADKFTFSDPDGPYEFPMWEKYSKLYHPMVSENSVAFIELRDSEEILSKLDADIYASMFANEDVYLVLSNLSGKPYELKLQSKWRDRVSGIVSDTFTVENERILFLIKE